MKVLLMHATVTTHDAVGNDIEQMYLLLQDYAECFVFAQNCFNNRVRYADKKKALEIMASPENVIIYHHSVYWQYGEDMLSKCRAKIVFRYHNVTPSSFFEKYNDGYFTQCKFGREQTTRLQRAFPKAIWLSDSKYNDSEITEVQSSQRFICPPFNKLSEWENIIPDENVLRSLMDTPNINLLFVGRLAPNKGHKTILEALKIYMDNYGDNIHLNIVGKIDENLAMYKMELDSMIKSYGIKMNVSYISEVTDQTLAAYYLGSDFFVCASEHEGFCVPIIEAQYFGLPVISTRDCAVPDTGGDGQICIERDRKKIASAISVLNRNRDYYKYIQKQGFENVNNVQSYENVKNIFLSIWNKVLSNR